MSAPGWYPSPSDPAGNYRWWDGRSWTDLVQTVPGRTERAPTRDDLRPETRVATIPERIAARAIDWVLAALLATGCNRLWLPHVLDEDLDPRSMPTLGEIAALDATASVLLGVVAFVLLWELYWLISEGASPGKQLVGLFVFDPKSGRGTVEPIPALMRNMHRPLQIIPFGWVVIALVSAGSLVFMFNDPVDRRSVMDRAAGTTVRRLPAGSPRFTPWLQVWLTAMVALYGGAWIVDGYLAT